MKLAIFFGVGVTATGLDIADGTRPVAETEDRPKTHDPNCEPACVTERADEGIKRNVARRIPVAPDLSPDGTAACGGRSGGAGVGPASGTERVVR